MKYDQSDDRSVQREILRELRLIRRTLWGFLLVLAVILLDVEIVPVLLILGAGLALLGVIYLGGLIMERSIRWKVGGEDADTRLAAYIQDREEEMEGADGDESHRGDG